MVWFGGLELGQLWVWEGLWDSLETRGKGKIWMLQRCHCLKEMNGQEEKKVRRLFVRCDGLR